MLEELASGQVGCVKWSRKAVGGSDPDRTVRSYLFTLYAPGRQVRSYLHVVDQAFGVPGVSLDFVREYAEEHGIALD